MPSKVTSKGRVPTDMWDASMTRQTAAWVEEIVYGRAFDQSQDTRDRPLAPTQAGNQPLVKTGLMRASLGVLESSETTAKIGVSGAAAEYAPHTEEARPWLGLSPDDLAKLNKKVAGLIDSKIAKQVRGV